MIQPGCDRVLGWAAPGVRVALKSEPQRTTAVVRLGEF
jgi:hypothetical protein